jgi:hypothetical protein
MFTGVALFFLFTALAMAGCFVWAVEHQRTRVAFVLAGWMVMQFLIAASGFYLGNASLPPRFALAVAPPLVVVLLLVLLPGGRRWLATLDVRSLLWLHVLRVAVELVLHQLHQYGGVPVELTWSGRNWDVLSGLGAALLLWRWRVTGQLPVRWSLRWNIIGLLLVLNVFVHGLLSGPSPVQHFHAPAGTFALLQAPYVWLPSLLVPLVMLAHAALFVQMRSTAGLTSELRS